MALPDKKNKTRAKEEGRIIHQVYKESWFMINTCSSILEIRHKTDKVIPLFHLDYNRLPLTPQNSLFISHAGPESLLALLSPLTSLDSPFSYKSPNLSSINLPSKYMNVLAEFII